MPPGREPRRHDPRRPEGGATPQLIPIGPRRGGALSGAINPLAPPPDGLFTTTNAVVFEHQARGGVRDVHPLGRSKDRLHSCLAG